MIKEAGSGSNSDSFFNQHIISLDYLVSGEISHRLVLFLTVLDLNEEGRVVV